MTPKALSRGDIVTLVVAGNFLFKVIDTTVDMVIKLLLN